MRIKIELGTNVFPRYYSLLGTSIIKEAIKKSSKEYFENLYYYEDKNNKASKNFTFSFFVKNYEIEKNNFMVKDRVTMYISTPDLELGLNIYNGIVNTKIFKYKEYEMSRIKVSLVNELDIDSEEVIFKTLSPICIKDNTGKFLNIDSDNYVGELNYITDIVLKNYRGYGLKKELKFENINLRKIVVKEPMREFKQITNREYQFVNSYRGKFILRGDSEDLNDIYRLGIGFKRGQGFGNIETVSGR
ncbi:CRISPR-associated endoribonuclease Cas6 [Romboutsia lituseburensis]|uniref:CRISPR-associated endoribonuclease Cas6 n=1 Tax=Romboutsia lituseburensis TaxID=1537 RepID=UPI00215AF9CD|nr:CRISPR-associated endoribonuclease Cas6 [Romboutsia lituseburensis]MCR8743765.1 CRISPR-associated endoribonuclease Cas6 [Romboutsia lituseburensis]